MAELLTKERLAEVFQRIDQGYHMTLRNQIFEDVLKLRDHIRALEAERDGLAEAYRVYEQQSTGRLNEAYQQKFKVQQELAQGTRAQLREVEAERDDLRVRLTARENELRTKLYTKS